jgi:hypothetical protein
MGNLVEVAERLVVRSEIGKTPCPCGRSDMEIGKVVL